MSSRKGQSCWWWGGTTLYWDKPQSLLSRLNWRLGIYAGTQSGCCTFCTALSTFVPQMFAFARNDGAGTRWFLAQWLRSWGPCHMKSRAQMGPCGTSTVIDCQSSLLWTWNNRVNKSHPSAVFWHVRLSCVPWGFVRTLWWEKQQYFPGYKNCWSGTNWYIHFLNSSITKRQSFKKSTV